MELLQYSSVLEECLPVVEECLPEVENFLLAGLYFSGTQGKRGDSKKKGDGQAKKVIA